MGAAQPWHHGAQVDQSGDRSPLGNQGNGEPAQRMADDDEIRAGVGERLDRGARVLDRTCGGVLARQIDGQPIMTAVERAPP